MGALQLHVLERQKGIGRFHNELMDIFIIIYMLTYIDIH